MQLYQYALIILWIGAVAVFARVSPTLKKKVNVLGVEEERFSWWFVLLLLIPLVLLAAYRTDIGDTFPYRISFRDAMPDSFDELSDYINSIDKDHGFYVFSSLIKILITKNHVIYFGILAAIQLISVFSVFRRYSNNFVLSVSLFVLSSDYFSWTHNGIRQFTAVTIIFAFSALIFNKKFFPLILVIIFASLFHQTALLMIPVVFFVQGEAWNKRTIILLFLVVLVLVFVGTFTDILDGFLADTQYKNVVSDYKEWNDNGTNPFRVAVYSVPAVISFIQRKEIRESGSRLISICANMSIVTAAIYIISMVTSGIFIGRLPIYMSLYNYILLPWEIEHFREGSKRRTLYVLMIILYLVFYYYQMHFAWNVF